MEITVRGKDLSEFIKISELINKRNVTYTWIIKPEGIEYLYRGFNSSLEVWINKKNFTSWKVPLGATSFNFSLDRFSPFAALCPNEQITINIDKNNIKLLSPNQEVYHAFNVDNPTLDVVPQLYDEIDSFEFSDSDKLKNCAKYLKNLNIDRIALSITNNVLQIKAESVFETFVQELKINRTLNFPDPIYFGRDGIILLLTPNFSILRLKLKLSASYLAVKYIMPNESYVIATMTRKIDSEEESGFGTIGKLEVNDN
jgi:hypothetical protein